MPYHIENRSSSYTTGIVTGLTASPHLHPHLEMIYLDKGSSIAIADYQDFLMEEGDLFLSFPNQIHYYHDLSRVKGYMFIFSPDLFKELKDVFQNKVPTCSVIKKEQMPPHIRASLEKIRQKNLSESSFDQIASRGYFLGLLGELLPCMTLVPKSSSHDSVKSILSYCSEKYTEPLSLDMLAKDLHLNKYYISHIFKERMGISFTDFVNGQRIDHACGLLEKDSDMTEIAFASGFSSIRTFNRAFAKHVGMSPREYLKSKEMSTIV